MIKFTKEEINLCKQVAEKHRKEIKYGDWYVYTDDKVTLHFHQNVGELFKEYGGGLNFIPLWTISDCLEFLKERKRIDGEIRLAYIDHHDEYFVHIFEENTPFNNARVAIVEKGKTPLEACLKAVIEVLK